MSTLSEIISAGVGDDSAANNAIRTNQLDVLVLNRTLGISLSISLDVTQVTNVSVLVLGSTMLLSVRVEVRTGRSASVGVVTESVDVKAALGIGVMASNVP